MNKMKLITFPILAVIITLLAGCPTVTDKTGNSGTNGNNTAIRSLNLEMQTVPSIKNFNMSTAVYIPHTVASITLFTIGKYEVTYKQWYTIRKWAERNGYIFANKGMEGSYTGGGTWPNYTNVGKEPSESKQPVTVICWRDAVVWCNALSEYECLKPCYTYSGSPVKNSTNSMMCDNMICSLEKNGYRLPTEAEWEYAARYMTETSLINGDHLSGAEKNYTDDISSFSVAVYCYFNNGNSTGVIGTADVGSKSDTGKNALGLLDMSGNVSEFCWDWFADYANSSPFTDADTTGPQSGAVSMKIIRGGSYIGFSNVCQVCFRQMMKPDRPDIDVGFRVVRRMK
jgi:formylglycine-generating enzyme